jgi:hypothetical protein
MVSLGCCGFMVDSAHAGERWSAESCKHLQEMEAPTYARNIVGAQDRFWSLAAIRIAQQDGCGGSTPPAPITPSDCPTVVICHLL